jgi:hypothetical protein
MNDEIETTTTTAKKPVKSKTIKKPRAPRKIDPAVEAIRAEAAEKIKAVHVARGSEKILQTIVAKRLPKMTAAHRRELFDELGKEFTAKLPGMDDLKP